MGGAMIDAVVAKSRHFWCFGRIRLCCCLWPNVCKTFQSWVETGQKKHDMTRLKRNQVAKSLYIHKMLQFSALASHATMSHRSGLLGRLHQGELEVALVLA